MIFTSTSCEIFVIDYLPESTISFFSNGPLAQLVEQFPFKEWVAGSNPARLTIN